MSCASCNRMPFSRREVFQIALVGLAYWPASVAGSPSRFLVSHAETGQDSGTVTTSNAGCGAVVGIAAATEACAIAENFFSHALKGTPDEVQAAVDCCAPADVGVELGFTRKRYVLIYHQNVALRLKQYGADNEFDFTPNGQWLVKQASATEVLVEQPATLRLNVSWFQTMGLKALMRWKDGGFEESKAEDLDNCPDGCPAKFVLRITKAAGAAW